MREFKLITVLFSKKINIMLMVIALLMLFGGRVMKNFVTNELGNYISAITVCSFFIIGILIYSINFNKTKEKTLFIKMAPLICLLSSLGLVAITVCLFIFPELITK